MTNDSRPRFAAVGDALPAALLVWKLGTRLVTQAGNNPAARRWAQIGAAAAGLVGLATVLVAVANTVAAPTAARLDQRLEDELADSFPASDPPAVTRAG
jgi:hypothetical protein